MSRIWNNHVENGEAYSAENFVIPAAGEIPHIQILNPAASGKRIRVRSLNATLGSAVSANISRYDTPLPTLGLPAGFIVENLLGGGPAEVAEMRSDKPVAAVGSLFWQINAPANVPAIYPPQGREWGMDLIEGQGILVQGVAGTVLIVNWQWVEVPL